MPEQHTTAIQPSQIPHEILIAEFNYIAQSTNQSSEDRARVSNYYLVTIGAAIAAIFSEKLISATQPSVYAAIGIGLIALGLLGLFTLLTLIRLRAGWLDGVAAMNQIKNYYKHICDGANLDGAFAWKDIPPASKLNSVAFWTAASVIIVDSAMVGLGSIFIIAFQTRQFMDESSAIAGGIIFGVAIILQLMIYFGLLAHAGDKVLSKNQSNIDWKEAN